jgi:hypothetical protein
LEINIILRYESWELRNADVDTGTILRV